MYRGASIAENTFMREQSKANEQHGSNAGSGGPSRKLRFGNYDLVRRIDVGGMGEVYLARQRTAFDREVAIKIIRSDLVHDATARKRFLREAEVNAYIQHEHILPLFEFGEEQGRLFMVTPYIAGGTLSRRLQAGPISLSEVYTLFTALVKAVAYIHRRGVVHRDLKPSNILLDREGNSDQVYVRLIDFGIATIQGAAASPPLTTEGTEVGTVAYMAPERLSGFAAPSNDIYSLGVILHQMLTGKLPSKDHHTSLPQPLEYVINRCLASQPSDRFTTAEELLNAFEYAYQYLKAAPQQSAAPVAPIAPSVQPPPQPMAGQSVAPVLPNRANISGTGTPGMQSISGMARPTRNMNPEIKILPRSEDLPPAPVPVPPVIPVQVAMPGQHAPVFGQEDYESPTVDIDPSLLATQGKRISTPSAPALPVVPPRRPKTKKRRRNPLLAILTLLIVFILLAMAVLFFFELSPALAVTANVNFGPQVKVVRQVFHIKGSVSKNSVDATTSTIPIRAVSNAQNGSLAGQTSQQCVIPPIFGCQQVVTQDDVDRLSAQLRQTLDKQIRQNLQQQVQSKGGTQVGTVQITDAPATANPQVGTQSKTVTVTINGQAGQGAYYSNADARTLARLLLTQQVQQLGANYMLINSSVQIGQSAYEGLDNNGQVLIAIAAAGVAQYQFPGSELVTIQNGLKGMKLAAATAYVKQQAGVDPASVSIHVSTGDTLPGDIQHIKIITINPATFPSFTLPQVTPVATATASQ